MNLLTSNGQVGEHAPSWYQATCPTHTYPTLTSDEHVDVGVIGAGYTGLSTALHLRKRGHSVTLLDAHRVAWGASGRNGGQLGSGLNSGQIELEQQYGITHAHALWRLCEDAKTTVHQLCKIHAIDAQYKPGIIAAKHRPRHVADAHRLCEKMARDYNYSQLQPLSSAECRELIDSSAYHGGVIDHGAGHIHPLAFGVGLATAASAAGVSIYELTRARVIDHLPSGDCLVRTDNGTVRASNIVLACNGYLDNLEPTIQQHVMPINNFMIATEPLGERADALLPRDHAVYDSRFVVNYFRLTNDKRLLFGGGETYGYRFPDNIKSLVTKPMLKVFPQLHDVRIDYAWGGTLAITRSRLPYVRMLKPTVYTASGYSGHGVALAVEAGKAIAEAIDGHTERFDTMGKLTSQRFPGGNLMRSALLKSAMLYYAMRDTF